MQLDNHMKKTDCLAHQSLDLDAIHYQTTWDLTLGNTTVDIHRKGNQIAMTSPTKEMKLLPEGVIIPGVQLACLSFVKERNTVIVTL